jgi:integrase
VAHQPKPFFRTGRGWYVQLATRQIKLCDGPKTGETEKAAWSEFHRLMAAPARPTKAAAADSAYTVAAIFEKFLDWCQEHRSERTYQWSKGHIQSLCDHLGNAGTLPVADLRPYHVVEWVDSKKTWGTNQKRNACGAVTRPFSWAEKLGYIPSNPVRGVERPTATKRESRMSPVDFDAILSHVKDGPFRDLITFVYEAGCRPQEARWIEARHLRPEHRRVELPPKEAKGKKRWRVIYLSDKALEIAGRLAALRPTGPLFLNTDGKPWKAQAVVCRFQRLLVKLSGVEDDLPPLPRFDRRKYPDPAARAVAKAKHQKDIADLRKKRAKLAREGDRRYAMYDIRHCFATRKLKEGHDPITVATLLGHKDTAMLARHYQELSKDYDHLLNAANGPSVRRAPDGGEK